MNVQLGLKTYLSRISATQLFLGIAVLGVALRLLAASRGWNWDMGAWWKHANYISDWRSFYQKLPWDNYAPGWSIILYGLNALPYFGLEPFLALRYKVVILLTAVDMCIAYLLWREYSIRASALFLLNPISILITGYHSQFDNIYVLCGLIAVLSMKKNEQKISYAGLSLLGFSMIIKHGLFLFPFWLAIRAIMAKNFRIAAATLYIPYALFFLSFIPFALEPGMPEVIWNAVVHYRGFNNAPFWTMLKPIWPKFILTQFTMHAITSFQLFIFTLCVLSMCWYKRKLDEYFFLYLLSMVIFSSTIANQYLTIVSVAIAIYPNCFFMLYMLLGGIYLAGDQNGLHIAWVAQTLSRTVGDANACYRLLIMVLFAGLLFMQVKLRRYGSLLCATPIPEKTGD